MSKLEKLILLFIENKPKNEVTITEIMKLTYLFEYFYYQTYGESYTEIDFIRYHYGPYSPVVNKKIDDLTEKSYLDFGVSITPYGNQRYHYSKKQNKTFDLEIEDNVIYIVDYITQKSNLLSFEKLLDWAYSTPPMEKIIELESGDENSCNGRRLDMDINKGTKKFTIEEIKEAGSRIDRSSKGSNEDYYSHILSIQKEMEPLRRRAIDCLER